MDDDPPPDPGFDVDRFVDDINSDEPLAMVLKAHLWLESMVIRAIQTHLIEPDALAVDRLSFRTKVSLGVALNALPNEVVAPLLALNQLRNRLAHRLGAELKDDDYVAVHLAMNPAFRAIPEGIEGYEQRDQSNRLRLDLASLAYRIAFTNVRAREGFKSLGPDSPWWRSEYGGQPDTQERPSADE